MSFTSPTDNRSYLSFDLSFLTRFSNVQLDTLPETLEEVNQRHIRIGYQNLGITGVTFGQTVEPVLSIRRTAENSFAFTRSLSRASLNQPLSKSDSISSIANSITETQRSPYYIKITTAAGKTIAAARITDRETALQSTSTYAKDLVKSYGVESPPQIILMEFPRLGPSEKPQTGTYSELDATAALVQSCFQQSLELFQTSCIKAIPGEQQTADYLSELGFSYESPKERDCPPPVTATTQMILFPEVREAWEQYVRNYPICMPKSF